MDTHRCACDILSISPFCPTDQENITRRIESIIFAYRSMLTYPVVDSFMTMVHLGIPPGYPSSSRILRYVLFGEPGRELRDTEGNRGRDRNDNTRDICSRLEGLLQDLRRIEPTISEAYSCFVQDMAEIRKVSELKLHMVPCIDMSFEVLMIEAILIFRKVFDRNRVVSDWISTDTSYIFS